LYVDHLWGDCGAWDSESTDRASLTAFKQEQPEWGRGLGGLAKFHTWFPSGNAVMEGGW